MSKNQIPSLKEISPAPEATPVGIASGSEELMLSLDVPTYKTAESENTSLKSIPQIPANGIEVMATRNGFYNLHRIVENDIFTVRKFEDLGEWMKCLDPDLEKERVKFFKNKKAI